MRGFTTILALVLCACGGGTFTPSGDASLDADAPADTEADVPADAPADAATDAGGGPCTEHLDCLDDRYCGPCGIWTCPCDPGEDPGCAPRCIPNPCHDGSAPICPSPPPGCAEYEVLTVVGGCWACLNVDTCRPWGEPGCFSDSDCVPAMYCDECVSGSCPGCEDCVAGCLEHGCATEDEALCDMARPDCGPDGVGVVRGGCWVCVDRTTCEVIDG
jgi:hypothetical protein